MSVSCTGHIIVNFTHILLEEHYDKLKVCVKDVCDEDDKLVLTGKKDTGIITMALCI